MTDEPERLKSSGDTPEELVRALRALGRDRDGERLARVAGQLSATLAANGAPAGGALSKLFGNKLALTGLALGLGGLGMLGYQLASRDAAPIEPPALPAAPPAPAPTPAPATAAPNLAPAPERVPSSSDADRTMTEPQPRVKRAPRPSPAPAAPAPSVAQPSSAAATGAEATTAAAEQSPPAPEDAKAAPQPPATPPASEELLLYRARKAAARDPSEALRLLDEHAARFSAGLLVPEREVLAIEVLRSLGRNAEAARRLQKFKARYPQSIHLRRLEQSGGSGGGE